MQVTPRSPIFSVLLVRSFTTPALRHMHNSDANIRALPIQWLYFVDVLPSRVTTFNPSSNIAVCKAYLHTSYLILNKTFAFLVISCSLISIVENPTSSRWYLCGVAFPVYLNYGFDFRVPLFAIFSSLVFSPALSHLTHFNRWPFCFHFSNCSHVGSIIPFLVA